MLGDVSRDVKMPLVTMVSYAIVYRHGLEKYVADAKAAGVAGAIVPDLLVEESDELASDLQSGRFQPDSARHADHAARAGRADRQRPAPVSLLRLRHRHHRRAHRAAAGAGR